MLSSVPGTVSTGDGAVRGCDEGAEMGVEDSFSLLQSTPFLI